jgi:alkanesulfonate monooxygenase SsuD/methylene tetrahydromethanopterin reductase-like flavin-dependent oxidoreductase (luciferase family)
MNGTGPLEMGIGFYSMQSAYMRPRRHSYLYEEAAYEARLAEELGFDVFWMGEHHHAYDGYCPSLLPAAAFLAAKTSRIVLATGVLIVPHHGAHRIAEASAAIQSVAPGRFRLGVGIGYWKDEFDASGINMRTRHKLLDTTLEQLVNGDLQSRFGATDLWFGVGAPKALLRAARYGASVVLPQPTVERYRKSRELWESELRVRSSRRPRMVVFLDTWVERDSRRIEWIKGRLHEMWRNYALNWIDDPSFQGMEPAPDFAGQLAQREAMAQRSCNSFVVGTPSQVVDRLAPFVEAGVDGFAFRIRFDGVGGPDLEQSMRLLAEEVVPNLQRMAR